MNKIIVGYMVMLLLVGFSTRTLIQSPAIKSVDFGSLAKGVLTAPLGEIPRYYQTANGLPEIGIDINHIASTEIPVTPDQIALR